MGLLYGTVGTLNMADIALRMDEAEHSGMVEVLAVMFMVAFGIKAAAFPLFFGCLRPIIRRRWRYRRCLRDCSPRWAFTRCFGYLR
ncbi:hypothetical protein DK37_18480 [Halomonas sp. SUBG004]|nr:hypothetical protein DK37_18480 [Halomonas sp. SUBG004]